jgi:hypothetical protein
MIIGIGQKYPSVSSLTSACSINNSVKAEVKGRGFRTDLK